MTARRMMLSAGLAAVVGGGALAAAGSGGGEASGGAVGSAEVAFEQLFEQSLAEKKGLTLYVGSHTIPGVVVRIAPDLLELRNQQFSKIVVRRDEVVAVALH